MQNKLLRECYNKTTTHPIVTTKITKPYAVRLFPVLVEVFDPEDAVPVVVVLELLDVTVPESFLVAKRISLFPKSKTATTFFKKASPKKASEMPAVDTTAPIAEMHVLLP